MRPQSNVSLFTTLGVVIVCAILVDIAADLDWLNPITMGLLHVACFGALILIVYPIVQRPTSSASQRAAFWALLATGGLLVLMYAIHLIPFIDASPPSIVYFITRILTLIWFTSPFVFIAINARILEQTAERLNEHVAKRTEELTLANHQLQREICERMLVSNELDKAKQDLELTLNEKTKELEEVEQQLLRRERLVAVTEIAAGVSHELNNTLTPIVSYANMLQAHSDLPDEQREWVHRISKAANSAVGVVHNLRQFHHQQRGTNVARTSPAVIAKQAVAATQPIWLDFAGTKGQTIAVSTRIECDSKIDADKDQMLHLLTNLILNAVDAIGDKDGCITVATRKDGGYVLLEVTDDGCGMTLDEIKCCFDPFYTTKSQRTGLGLSASHGIVRRHGGTIDIQTTIGVGTTFRVRLPIAVEQEASADSPDPVFESQQFDNVRVLLVEDSDSVRDALTDLLEMLGAKVTPVDGGPSALTELKSSEFDVLLTDLGLEGMSGIELMSEARQFCELPTILMSGWPRVKVMAALDGHAPPEGLLSKPARFDDIVAVIAEATSCHPSATA